MVIVHMEHDIVLYALLLLLLLKVIFRCLLAKCVEVAADHTLHGILCLDVTAMLR